MKLSDFDFNVINNKFGKCMQICTIYDINKGKINEIIYFTIKKWQKRVNQNEVKCCARRMRITNALNLMDFKAKFPKLIAEAL